MTAAVLLADLGRRGIALFVDGERLRYRGPRGGVTEADRGALVPHKAALLGLLADLATLEQDGTADSLRGTWADLPDSDRTRLRDEADAGDGLAGLVLAAVAVAPAPISAKVDSIV